MTSTKKNTITLSIDTLREKVAELTELDQQANSKAGTMGEIMAKSKAEVSNLSYSDDWTWGEYLTELNTTLTEAIATFEQAVADYAGQHITSHREDLAGIAARREALANHVYSMYDLFVQMGMDVSDVTLPPKRSSKAIASHNNGTSPGRKRAEKVLSIYRVNDDGTRKYLTNGSTLSLVAFQWFGKCGVEALKSAILAAGGSVDADFEAVNVTVTTDDGTVITRVIGGQVVDNA